MHRTEMDSTATLSAHKRKMLWDLQDDVQRETTRENWVIKAGQKKNDIYIWATHRSFMSLQTVRGIFAQHIMPVALSGHSLKKIKNKWPSVEFCNDYLLLSPVFALEKVWHSLLQLWGTLLLLLAACGHKPPKVNFAVEWHLREKKQEFLPTESK